MKHVLPRFMTGKLKMIAFWKMHVVEFTLPTKMIQLAERDVDQCLKSSSIPNKRGWPDSHQHSGSLVYPQHSTLTSRVHFPDSIQLSCFLTLFFHILLRLTFSFDLQFQTPMYHVFHAFRKVQISFYFKNYASLPYKIAGLTQPYFSFRGNLFIL